MESSRRQPLDRGRLQRAIARIRSRATAVPQGAPDTRRARLQIVVEKLKDGILSDFRRYELPRFQRLHEIFEKGWGLPVPALSICGQGTAEIRYTKLLSWFFDHRNPHGLGSLLAKTAFHEILGVEANSLDECIAETEILIGSTEQKDDRKLANVIDMHLRFGDRHVYIEQKIGSAEGPSQLKRYADCLAGAIDPNRDRLVFLTPEGRVPSDKRWVAMSYRDLFPKLASVLERHLLSPVARHNLRGLLWDLMLGPIASDPSWIDAFREITAKVAKNPDKQYISLSRFLSRYGLEPTERRILLQIVED